MSDTDKQLKVFEDFGAALYLIATMLKLSGEDRW